MYPVIRDAIIGRCIPMFCEQLNSTVIKAIYTKQENRLLGICLQVLNVNIFLYSPEVKIESSWKTVLTAKNSLCSHDTAHVARHTLETSRSIARHYEDILQTSHIT